jgi:glutamate synthase (NADPH/NADH) large chain/glutamate synthase (ferredoxin)
LYGATGGVLFAAGQAGERFAVRNSGGTAVVEGLGDHGSEYMTGGTVVCLGETGVNFGAGMSGGMAFIFDEADHFDRKYNPEMISISRLDENEDIENLSKLIHHHAELTKSPKAQDILKNWDQSLQKFWKVAPTSVPEGVPTTLKLTDSVVALTV